MCQREGVLVEQGQCTDRRVRSGHEGASIVGSELHCLQLAWLRIEGQPLDC